MATGVESKGFVMHACSIVTMFPRKTAMRSNARAQSRTELIVFSRDLSVPPAYEGKHGELLLQVRAEE